MSWKTVTGPHAFCQGCEWYAHGDDKHPQTLALEARAHVDGTGHRVQIQRGQMRWVEPKASDAKTNLEGPDA